MDRFVINVYGSRAHAPSTRKPKEPVVSDAENPPGECHVLVRKGKAITPSGARLKAEIERYERER